MPVCPGCGSSYEDQFAFCPYCGRAKPQDPKPIKIEVTHSHAGSSRACPQCHRDDQVVLVSAYIQQNTSSYSGSAPVEVKYQDRDGTTHWHSETVSVHGTQSTKLVDLFYLPHEPFGGSFMQNLLFFLVAGFAIGFAFYLILFILLVISLVNGTVVRDITDGIVPFFLTVLLALGTFFTLPIYKRIKKRDQLQFDQAREQWKNGKHNWEQLYYCYRDGIVYIPGRPTSAKPEDMWEYCCSE